MLPENLILAAESTLTFTGTLFCGKQVMVGV